MKEFKKRIYHAKGFLTDGMSLGKKLPSLIRTLATGSVSSAFREKVMLAVTGVNDCRYCTFVHTNLARFSGVDAEEIRNILCCELGAEISPDELFAIEFARHYAQTKKNPDPEMTDKLVEQYGQNQADEIILYLDTIFFANITGNTFDAFLSRLKGARAQGSSLAFELPLALLLAPILLPQTAIINLKTKLGMT
jgi:AhpD family alkylhydroperoxidase